MMAPVREDGEMVFGSAHFISVGFSARKQKDG